MALVVHLHPLASFCMKVLIVLYENGTAFEPHIVDLGDPASRADFLALWPIGRFPVLVDPALADPLPESSIIIEHLDRHHPGPAPLIPVEAAEALEVRLWDRLCDHYIDAPMQTIVTDRIRPPGNSDAYGVQRARATLDAAYGVLDARMTGRTWLAGEQFSLADCAAAPALFYADKVHPCRAARPSLSAYLDRLLARPSFARVLDEAKPYFALFPS